MGLAIASDPQHIQGQVVAREQPSSKEGAMEGTQIVAKGQEGGRGGAR